jgi:hypothetical protein
MTLAYTHDIPPLEAFLSKASPVAHPLIVDTYNKMKADPSVGKSRAQSMALGGWGMTSERAKEQSGILQTWTDGANVRVGTASLYLHLLTLIVESHPVDAPARKARTPVKPFFKGHRRKTSAPRTPAELEGLRIGNAKRAEATRRSREAKTARV